MKTNKTNIVRMGIILVMAVAGGFVAGMKYQQGKGSSVNGGQNTMQSAGRGIHNNGEGQQVVMGTQHRRDSGMVGGEIINQDDASITIKLDNESTKIVLFSEETGINMATEGSLENLAVGEQVVVFGQENSDGSVTATSIQLNPLFRMGAEK